MLTVVASLQCNKSRGQLKCKSVVTEKSASMDGNLEYQDSKRGKRKLVHEGFLYTRQKSLVDGNVAWTCEQRGVCKARVHVGGGQILKTINQHTHAPSVARCDVVRFASAVRSQARQTQETAQQILTTNTALLSDDAAAKLPGIHHLRRVIRRNRQIVDHPLPQPADRQSIPELPDR